MHAALQIGLRLVGAGLVLWSWPLFAELLVLSLAAALPVRPVRHREREFALGIIVPAHNEEKLIATTVRNLIENSTEDVRVFVVAHNCTDETAARAREAGAVVLVLKNGVRGKGVALDHGFMHAVAGGAEGLLVIDADSVVSANLTRVVSARLAAGAAALQCRYEVANASTNARTGLAGLAFLGMNVLRPRGRERLGLSCGIFGNGFALAAATLARVPYTANSLVEDLEYHLHLLEAGLRVEFADEATVFGEMPEGGAAAATQRARWEGGRLLMRRRWAGPLALRVAGGHVRMLEPLFDLLALPLATEAGLLGVCVLLGWLGGIWWLLGYGLLGMLAVVLYVGVSASLAPDPGQALRALGAAPGYLVWKLSMVAKTRLAARGDGAWVRTKRNSED